MKPMVVIQTDFGNGGGGAMTGVIKSIDPEVEVINYNHNIEPYNISAAGFSINFILPVWPAGTVFVSVVDPGVGTDRRSCVVRFKNGSYLVSPDNGILTPMIDKIDSIRRIDETVNRLPGSEHIFIFHGRDVYAYTAGRLASGQISFEEVGPEYSLDDIVRFPMTNVPTVIRKGFAQGGIFNFDMAFGTPRIAIRHLQFRQIGGFEYGDIVHLKITDGDRTIFDQDVIYERSFGYTNVGAVLICGNSELGEEQSLRLAINRGDFARTYMPEVVNHSYGAVNYVVTITAID